MLVDHQAHWYTPKYFESILGRPAGRYPRAERMEGGYVFEYDDDRSGNRWLGHRSYYDIELHVADLAAAGVDVSVISPNMIGDVTRMELGEAREALDLINDEIARVQEAYADRVVGLAMLPMQDTTAALETLEHAIGKRGLSGVCMITNIDGRPLASEETLPVFQRIAELGVPLFLHPSNRSLAFPTIRSVGRATEVGLGWMFETSTAALSLIYSGTLDACPDLTVVHPHAGGVLPFIRGRMDLIENLHGVQRERSVSEYLASQFYVDSVNATPGALTMAAETYGADRILFATDFPWHERQVCVDVLEATESELAARIRINQLPGLALPVQR
jgi:predicted TIM-barrel fold metal-dependent hydrolase